MSHVKQPLHDTIGIIEIFFSQIPDFDQISWLSAVAAVMSFTYSCIGLILGIMQVACKSTTPTLYLLDLS